MVLSDIRRPVQPSTPSLTVQVSDATLEAHVIPPVVASELRELAEYAVASGRPLRVQATNEADFQAYERAGLFWDGEAWCTPVVIDVPAGGSVSPELRAELLQLWTDVTAAGGAVGFSPGTPASVIAPVLDGHIADIAAGTTSLVALETPDGRAVAFGFWALELRDLFAHTAMLKRFQTAPDLRRRNLGRLCLIALHRQVAARDAVEILRLDYRSGYGTGRFYEGLGYVEVGREPRVIQPEPGDYRDLVAMVRRVDGAPLTPDGRH